MAGTYTDITEIVAPESAVPGQIVNVIVRIKNIHSSTVRVRVAGVLEEAYVLVDHIYFLAGTADVGAGQTHSFAGSVTMPNKQVDIRAYSYYLGADNNWHLDDMKTKTLELAELVAEFSQFAIVDYYKG